METLINDYALALANKAIETQNKEDIKELAVTIFTEAYDVFNFTREQVAQITAEALLILEKQERDLKSDTLKKQQINITSDDVYAYKLSINIYAGLPRDYLGSASKLLTRSVKNVTTTDDTRSGVITLQGKKLIVESFQGMEWEVVGKA